MSGPVSPAAADVVGVVLAAGRGSRMSPITNRIPKPLLTVDNHRLLDLAIARIGALTPHLAVNAHHLADQIVDAVALLDPAIHVSVEPELLGTAGALRRLRPFLDGRPVLLTNADLWLSDPIPHFLDGWDGTAPRLLVQDIGRPSDFGTLRYMGVSTVPAAAAARLEYSPSGLYSALWRDAFAAGRLEFVELTGRSFDCGTPAEFLTANLSAAAASAAAASAAAAAGGPGAGDDSGGGGPGASVVAPDARVLGSIDRSVVLAGATVEPGEHLVCAIRDRFGHTMTADPEQVHVLR